MTQHGFDKMAKSARSVAIELHENANAIEAWRETLPEKQRKRLVHPLSNVRRWRASLNHGHGKCPQDLKRELWPHGGDSFVARNRYRPIKLRHCGKPH
jgi:hypothetical protein